LAQTGGCVNCHTPPLYTNNKLTLAEGFTPPPEHFRFLDIMRVSVGTDPGLALKTRKGTGYYKVPSLKGVWYRGRYLHDGSLTSLEEMFNPARLEETFEPSGFKPPGFKARAVKGHVRVETERRRAHRADRVLEESMRQLRPADDAPLRHLKHLAQLAGIFWLKQGPVAAACRVGSCVGARQGPATERDPRQPPGVGRVPSWLARTVEVGRCEDRQLLRRAPLGLFEPERSQASCLGACETRSSS
jgi:hypothetical protein